MFFEYAQSECVITLFWGKICTFLYVFGYPSNAKTPSRGILRKYWDFRKKKTKKQALKFKAFLFLIFGSKEI